MQKQVVSENLKKKIFQIFWRFDKTTTTISQASTTADVFIPVPRPFLQSQLARAQRQTFVFETEVSAKFAAPEDTMLSKLERSRLGGETSER